MTDEIKKEDLMSYAEILKRENEKHNNNRLKASAMATVRTYRAKEVKK